MKILNNQKGQGLIEYILIVALIAVGTMGIVRVFGQSLSSRFAAITYAVQGKSPRNLETEEISDSLVKKKDMSDFFNGAASGRQGGLGSGSGGSGGSGSTSGSQPFSDR